MILKIFTSAQSKIRSLIADIIRRMYCSEDLGISAIISALNDFRDNVIILFDDTYRPLGAASYYISKKRSKTSYIEIDHIGVIDRGRGYGTLLMKEIFKIAKLKNRDYVSLVSNGHSNDFYEKIGMIRTSPHLPAVYEMPKYLLECY